MNSKLGKLNWLDAAKGFIVAVGTAGISTLLTSLNAGHLPNGSEWTFIGIATLSAALSYLLKQLGTNSDGTIGGKEVK